MSDPTALNEMLKQVTEAYRVFSLELNGIQAKKTDLIKAILERVRREQTDDIKKVINEMIYERTNTAQN